MKEYLEITELDIASISKFFALVALIFSFFLGVLTLIWNPENINRNIVNIVFVLPLLSGCMGAIAGALVALVYNKTVSDPIGGIKLKVIEIGEESNEENNEN